VRSSRSYPKRELNFSIFEKQPDFVYYPVNWKYSSARNYGNDDQTILEIDLN
jgi:hypothetical protein